MVKLDVLLYVVFQTTSYTVFAFRWIDTIQHFEPYRNISGMDVRLLLIDLELATEQLYSS